MKHFSFKIVILCLLLPPVLYMFSAWLIESNLKAKYPGRIEEIYIGDTQPLFEGSVRLQDAICKNIDQYLQNDFWISWGIKANVIVRTKRGTLLYPKAFEQDEDALPAPNVETATDNYSLLSEGLAVDVDVIFEHNTPVSYTLLATYLFIAIFLLYFHYKTGLSRALQDDREKSDEINRLLDLQKEHTAGLGSLLEEKENLASEFVGLRRRLENEKERAGRNEDQMIEEIVALEQKIEKNLALQNEQQKEIDVLQQKMKPLKKGKEKASDIIQKRFKALYKNLSVMERAIAGFTELSEEMKLKCEELIHQLNESPELVQIKRKVFGKKGSETVLEVIFAYKGRLYFRRTKDKKTEVLSIGTKNTQGKDLEFLDNI